VIGKGHGSVVKSLDPSKELRLMLAFFGESQLPQCEQIPAEAVPPPFHGLLVHDQHMTVALEAYHRSRVLLRPYLVHRQGDLYGRKLDLVSEDSAAVVLTGIMLFNLSVVAEPVRQLILEQKIPLGRLLIENNVLRQVSTESFLRIAATDPLVARFHLAEARPAYARLATIFCDERPAVDLLEIVNPAL
jgi:hypothetical protein